MVTVEKVVVRISPEVLIELTPDQAKELLATLKEIFEVQKITEWVPIERPYPCLPSPTWPPFPIIWWR